ncbi:hypothetical protein BDV32DRAFT_9802 [Aspergillus pseudonomiae]|uniref:Uncharacterized protein n=1 Tax=Aspergillus pseudonomiae TaxID=1506151 RepID=A0A5N6HKT0_9EURO|nr:uncharacterized protein BDV37DRAFT_264083 [Aspergillus pseudonomiae]KAB8254858.1 hypothetical protein BDV32DRAFT_9802 [Aspergillus pseudonomiae]KAE8398184.1 hypothetical protein BDV37DRAFT_264083 [Aspergillus pseudonomiae]
MTQTVVSTTRRQTKRKRSSTGCRTCRSRHVKCDEFPDTCRNCSSTGRICEGYDMHRLTYARSTLSLPSVGSHICRALNTDERRYFSYFQHHVIANFVAFFDWQLWQRLVLQMVDAEPAVYHAVNMLAAIHEDSVASKMQLTGTRLNDPRHLFALEQSTRSLALLRKRGRSQDPQVRELTLMCCLLFTLSEFLLGHYTIAFQHLRGGIRILNEEQQVERSSKEQDLVEAFRRLDIMGTHYGIGPYMTSNTHLEEQGIWNCIPAKFKNLEEALQAVRHVMAIEVPWVTKCWSLSEAEILANYEQLCQKQRVILAAFDEFAEKFETLYQNEYPTLSPKEQRGADLLRLQYLSQTLTVKICLTHGPVPEYLTPEFVTLLAAHKAFIQKSPERPSIFLDIGIISGLYCVSNRCPDHRVRLQAIEALQSWPHFQGMMNSNLVSAIAIVRMQSEAGQRCQQETTPVLFETEENLTRLLFDTLTSTQQANCWPSLQYGNALQGTTRCGNTENGLLTKAPQ